MKLNRLLEIILILSGRRSVTAAELAERFDVSVRTIYRDIEALSASGIPIYTTQGQGGGISLMEQYSLSKAMLSKGEQERILFALQTLQAVNYPEAAQTLEKMKAIFQSGEDDWLGIDFAPWSNNGAGYEKFQLLQCAISQCHSVQITYTGKAGHTSSRLIDPLRLQFRYQAWYLWAWCHVRQAGRTFRLSRIGQVLPTRQPFHRPAQLLLAGQSPAGDPLPTIPCVLRFASQAIYRVYDDYDDSLIKKQDDGSYLLYLEVEEDEWLYGYIASFGPMVEVLEPARLRKIIQTRAFQAARLYENHHH